MWDPDELVELAASALRRHEQALAGEQAVYGLDALDEVGIHPLLAGGFERARLGVWREHPYPGVVEDRDLRRDRERCDLVLTREPGVPLIDPVEELKQLDAATGTLFAPVASSIAADRAGVEPGEACWIEVKAVAQHAYVSGVPGPNRAYATDLVAGPAGDAVKIAREPMVLDGVAMIVLFTEDAPTAEHDLAQAAHGCLDRGAPVGAPVWETFAIEDRAGNGACTVAALPIRL